ncbi:unnamed protein product, partial [Arabidopsis halleri]
KRRLFSLSFLASDSIVPLLRSISSPPTTKPFLLSLRFASSNSLSPITSLTFAIPNESGTVLSPLEAEAKARLHTM